MPSRRAFVVGIACLAGALLAACGTSEPSGPAPTVSDPAQPVPVATATPAPPTPTPRAVAESPEPPNAPLIASTPTPRATGGGGAAPMPTPAQPVPAPDVGAPQPSATPTPTPAPTPTPLPDGVQITVEEVVNRVETQVVASGAEFAPAAIGQPLRTGDFVKTFERSQARIDIDIGELVRTVRTAPSTLWRLGEFTVEDGAVIELASGTVFVIDDGSPEGHAPLRVVTPTGSASPRGTWMSVAYDPATDVTTVRCFIGSCVAENELGSVELQAGEKTSFGNDAPPAPPEPLTQQEIDEFVALPEQAPWTNPGPAAGVTTTSLAVADDGAVYLAGFSSPSTGRVVAFSAEGQMSWAAEVAGVAISSAIVAPSGGVFVSGVDAGPAGAHSGWLAHLDDNGAETVRCDLGPARVDSPPSLAVDSRGIVYVALSRPVGNASVLSLSAEPCEAGTLWTRDIGASAQVRVHAISIGPSDEVYLAGDVGGSLLGQQHEGLLDGWVAKLDTTGQLVRVAQLGSSGEDMAQSIQADAGGVYVAGSTDGAFVGEVNGGGLDVWVARLDSDLGLVWIDQIGSAGDDVASAVAAGDGGVRVAGWTGASLAGAASAGGTDAFVATVADGETLSVVQFGTENDDAAIALADGMAAGWARDADGNVAAYIIEVE